MADYKLSELNSIDTIRSDDLLHVRVKKRPEMLGDEDRRMTYQDFLASFKLERFVQIAGSTMTGDLGIVKLLYGGKAVFDPTGSSEITMGDVLKTFKLNANGLKLTIADASRSATVYHTLNKPSPNELGMRTNEENDARYARLAVTNTFSGTQQIQGDANLLRLRNQNANNAQYIEGVDLDGSARWLVGISKNGSDAVQLYNNKYDSALTIASNISVNKSLAITGQVQPSDFSNLDARYFTQTVANQRFAQLAGNNTFSGANTFNNYISVNSDATAIVLKNKTVNESLLILAKDIAGNNLWYIGKGDANDNITFYDYKGNTSLVFNSSGAAFNKSVKITGQVQPSDFSNLDARYYTQSAANSRYMLAYSSGGGTEVGDGDGIVWNAKTGLYNVYNKSGGSTHLVYQMYIGGGSTPTAQLKFSYGNGGIFYRTARDGYGFEQAWSKIYTDQDKPTPSDIGAYTKAETDQRIAETISDSTDLNKIYPVGIVTWFNSNVNPNTALPGLTWTYLNNGVGRTIRIAAANGSDVATTGGSDSVTLSVGNLPSHTHSFSATTSSFDYGTKTSNSTGAHTHTVSGSTNNTGAHTHTVGGRYGGDSIGGKQRVQVSGTNQVSSSAGAHSHTVSGTAASAGAHSHTVGIGAHTHTVSGNTGGTGSGSAFSVTNQFYKLMAWVRTA